jgi:hypothetical protein
MLQAYLDEAGDETPFSGTPYLAVALLTTSSAQDLDRAVVRAHRKYGAGLASGEMKADASPPAVTTWLLHAIAVSPVEIVAVVVDKSAIIRPPTVSSAIYHLAVAETVRRAAQRQPQLDLHLDKHYTSPKLRQRLEETIHARLTGLAANVLIRHEDSIAVKELQAADFVAWAVFQKYARDRTEFYQIIAPRVVDEELVQIALW